MSNYSSGNIAPKTKTLDTFVSQKNCSLCQLKYNLYKREHRCKRCFRSICQDCGLIKRYIIGYNISPNIKHKVCYLCGKDSYDMQTLSEKYNLRWSCDSIVGQNWLSNLYKPEELNKDKFVHTLKADQELTQKAKKSEAYSLFENFAKNSYQEFQDVLKRNYSYREMLHYLQKYDNIDKILKDIIMILRAFVNRYHDIIGFSLELVDITIFLLCFNSPPSAYAILRILYGQVLNPDMYPASIRYYFSGDTLYQGTMLKTKIFQDSIIPGKNQKVEKQDFKTKNEQISNYLLDVMKNLYPIDIGIIPVLQKFFEIQALPCILSFMVMKVNFSCSYYLMNEIMTAKAEKRPQLLIKSVIATTYCNLESVKYGSQNPAQVLSDILDNTQLKYLRQNLKHHSEIREFKIEGGASQLNDYKKKIQALEQENSELKEANESLIEQIEAISIHQDDLLENTDKLYTMMDSHIKDPKMEGTQSEHINQLSKVKDKIDNFKSQQLNLSNIIKKNSQNKSDIKNDKQEAQFPKQVESVYQLYGQGNEDQQQKSEKLNDNSTASPSRKGTSNVHILELKLDEQQKQIEILESELKQSKFKLEKYENRNSAISNNCEEQFEQQSKQSVIRNSKSQQLDMTLQLQEKEQEIVQLKLENQELQEKILDFENLNSSNEKQLKDMKKSLSSVNKSLSQENNYNEQVDKLKEEKQILENIVQEQHDQIEKSQQQYKQLEEQLKLAEKQKLEAQNMANQLNTDVEAKEQIICELEEQITKYQLLQDQINEQIQAYNQEVPQGDDFDPQQSQFKNSKKSEIFNSIFEIQKNPKNSELEDPEQYKKIREQVKQENQSKMTGFEQNIKQMQDLLAQIQGDMESDSDEDEENQSKNKKNNKTIQEQNEEEFEEVELGKADENQE